MLKWNHKYRESQSSSLESTDSICETPSYKEPPGKASKWKKINNTLKFINASKAGIGKSTDKNCLIRTKRKNPSKWTLLKNTFSIVNFFSRLQKLESLKFKSAQKVSSIYRPKQKTKDLQST